MSDLQRRLSVLLMAMCATVANAAAPEPTVPSTIQELRWRNGDMLSGTLVSATNNEVIWRSPLFMDDVRVKVEAVHDLRLPHDDRSPYHTLGKGRELQILETVHGNRFFGKVVSVNADFVEMECRKFGRIEVKRSAVRYLTNPNSDSLFATGVEGLDGWSTRTYGRKLSEWKELPGGRLTTNLVAAELYRPLDFHGRIDIDLELEWSRKPSFQIRFLTPFAETTRETLKIETRLDNYVIQTLGSDGEFQQLGELPKTVNRARFILRWNHAAHELGIFHDNKFLGKMVVKADSTIGIAGLYLKNTGPRLTLNRLTIRGAVVLGPELADPSVDTVQTTEEHIAGTVSVGDGGKDLSIESNDGTTRHVDWKKVFLVRFRQEELPGGDAGPTSCLFHDGERLAGRFVKAAEDGVWLSLPSLNKDVFCRFGELTRVLFNDTSDPPKARDARIQIGAKTLHGKLSGGIGDIIAWTPVGGMHPCRLTNATPARLTLDKLGYSALEDLANDVLVLQSGDAFPCSLKSIDQATAKLETSFSAGQHISNDQIRRVEFRSPIMKPVVGFGDKGWKQTGKVEATPETVTFSSAGSWSNATALRGDTVEFRIASDNSRLPMLLHIVLMGETMASGIQSVETIPLQIVGDRVYVAAPTGRAMRTSSSRPRIRIHASDPLRIDLDGEVFYESNRRSGPYYGISFQLKPDRFNNQLRWRAGGERIQPGKLTISNFRISAESRRRIRLPDTDREFSPLLTIPRQRPEHPKQLLVGSNLDLLRGHLISVDDQTILFRSRLEDHRVERSAAAGVLWFDREDGAKPAPMTRIVLKNQSVLSLHEPRIIEQELIGLHPQLGDCRFAIDDVAEILLGDATSDELQVYGHASLATKTAKEPRFVDVSGGQNHRVDSPLLGKELADLEFPLLDGGMTTLADYRGQVLVLDFWATWCAPCVKNMSSLIETINDQPKGKVSLLAINQLEDGRLIRIVQESRKWDLNIGLDTSGALGRTFLVDALPQTVVIDQAGKVSAVLVGTSADFHTELKDVLRELLPSEEMDGGIE